MVCLFLAIATLKDWDTHSVDIKTVYLYSNLDMEIYIEQLEGFKLFSKKKKVWQLHEVLYSLIILVYITSLIKRLESLL